MEDLLADTLTPANIHKGTRIDGETPSSFCHPPVTPGSTVGSAYARVEKVSGRFISLPSLPRVVRV